MSEQTAVLGAGVIGASWTSLFLAAGHRVTVYDPMEGSEDFVRRYVDAAWPVLGKLGLTERGDPRAINFVDSAVKAVEGAGPSIQSSAFDPAC